MSETPIKAKVEEFCAVDSRLASIPNCVGEMTPIVTKAVESCTTELLDPAQNDTCINSYVAKKLLDHYTLEELVQHYVAEEKAQKINNLRSDSTERFDNLLGLDVVSDFLMSSGDFSLGRVRLGPTLTLFSRLVISTQGFVGVPLLPPLEKTEKKWVHYNTGDSRIETSTEKYRNDYAALGGTLDLKIVAYRGSNSAVLLGLDGSMGRVPTHFTMGSAAAIAEFMLYERNSSAPAVGLFTGGGILCNITDGDCFGMMQSGVHINFF